MAEYHYVRKSVRWEGKRYEVRGQTEAETLEKMVELLAALRDGRSIRNGDTLVEIWYQEWKRVYKVPSDLTRKSLKLYDEKYNKYIGPVLGTMRLRDVRNIHLQSILNEQRGMSFSHVTKLRMVMQEMFHQAYRSRLIAFDPSDGLKLPKNEKRSHRSITDEERTHILEVASYHPSGLWVLLILYTGLRPGEAAALQWKDIDFDRNEIHVYKAIESGTSTIKTPKTPAGVRDIPMRRDLRQLLWNSRGDPFSLLFPTKKGTIRSPSSVWRLWNSFSKELDLHMGAEQRDGKIIRHAIAPDLTLYCLRHTFCTDLQRAGVAINIAKELMGHSSITVTADIYTHRNLSILHQNISRLDSLDTGNFQQNSLF